MTENILLRNAGYEPMKYISLRKAHGQLIRGKTSILAVAPGDHFYGGLPVPSEVILKRYVKMTWREGVPKFSRKRLFMRDNKKCAYCLGEATDIDHVYHVKSKGGQLEWDNAVAACKRCNGKKGNRSPKEANMTLLFEPFIPTWEDLYTETYT